MRSPDLPMAHPPLEIELVVVPTFNERENVGPLLERLNTALTGIRWEAILVDDDFPDGTADLLAKPRREGEMCASLGGLADEDCRVPASMACSHHQRWNK